MHLSPLFSDGMVLQANKPIRIFGCGGGHLHLELNGLVHDSDIVAASWCVELGTLPYGGPYELKAELDGVRKTVKDVYLGDVYLLGGQSNMQFRLRDSNYPEADYESFPKLRLFACERMESGEAFHPEDGWVSCTKENAGGWSCIGYIVGQYLMKKRSTAVGLIACYQGAAAIQAFLPDRSFADGRFIVPENERYDMAYPWNGGHSQLYNYMVKPILPVSLAAVLWYQGESNCSEKESLLYGDMLNTLIDTWREDFKDPALRFVIVQIADFEPRLGITWTRIQQAQTAAGKRENVDTVISANVCERDMIHPVSKTELSRRIAELL